MEEILKELMSTKCVSMHNNQFRCYGKECDGQCALFQATLITLKETTRQVHNVVSEYKEENL